MATTSLWHIEGRLKDLIAYVENPEKTKADKTNFCLVCGRARSDTDRKASESR